MQVVDESAQVLLALDQIDHASGDDLGKVVLTEALFNRVGEVHMCAIGRVECIEVVEVDLERQSVHASL